MNLKKYSKKFISSALVLSLLTAGAVPAQGSLPVIDSPIVLVLCAGTLGTAFRVSENRYVTAWHVIDGPGCSVGGVPVSDVYSDSQRDFAMFTGPRGRSTLSVSCKPYKTKEEYIAKGYGAGAYMETPWIASRQTQGHYQTFVGEGIPGMSGGPVLGDDAKVYGIVNKRWPTRSLPLANTKLCKGD